MEKSFDALLRFKQSNSEAERRELLKIIFSNSHAVLAFLKTDFWNYYCSKKLFLEAINVIIDNKDFADNVDLFNQSHIFKKIPRNKKIKITQNIVDGVNNGKTLQPDKLNLVFSYQFTPFEMKHICDLLKTIQDKFSIKFHYRFLFHFEEYIDDQDMWNFIDKIQSDEYYIDLLLTQPIHLTTDMMSRLKSYIVANKLRVR